MTVTGIVYDIMRFALHDGPGIRTTVFFKGCPLRCWWCANPESQSRDPEFIYFQNTCLECDACIQSCSRQAIQTDARGYRLIDRDRCDFCGACVEACYPGALRLVGRAMTVDAVMAEVLKDREIYRDSGGGVTYSGGEPLFQPQFLADCLMASRREHLHTAVETTGAARWDVIEGIMPWVDLFLYDLKIATPDLHTNYTGASNTIILKNLRKLVSCHEVIVRLPMVPKVNDRGDAWTASFDFLQQLPWRGRIDLLPYHRLGVGKYEALNRNYALDASLKPDMEIVGRRQAQLEAAGFSVQLYGG